MLFVSLSAVLWCAVSLAQKNRPVAWGAGVMSAVTGLAAMAENLRLMSWLEGGWGMYVLTLTGGYALSAAVAHRASKSRGAFSAAVTAAVFTVALGGLFFWQAMDGVIDAVQYTDPATAARIIAAGRGEALRLVELATALALGAGLLTLRRPPARLFTTVQANQRAEVS